MGAAVSPAPAVPASLIFITQSARKRNISESDSVREGFEDGHLQQYTQEVRGAPGAFYRFITDFGTVGIPS